MSKAAIQPQVRDNFKIDSLVARPQNLGEISANEAKELNATLFTYSYGSCENGLAIKIFWAVDSDGKIIDCKLQVFGESELAAVASIAGLICKNKSAGEILNLKEKGLEYFLRENPNTPALPNSKRFLTNVMIDALYMAANSFLGVSVDEGPIVDNFSGATMRFIKDTIDRFEVKELSDLEELTRAGLYDKSCQYPGAGENLSNYYLSDILKERLQELKEKKENINLDGKDFKSMSDEEKLAAVNAIIDKHIRHMLVMDGGDMEILDIKTNGEDIDIYIRYLGACNGCASSSTGTLFAIEGILKQKLNPNIRVLPL
jgi:NifU-like protein